MPQRNAHLKTAEDCLLPCLPLHPEHYSPWYDNGKTEQTTTPVHIHFSADVLQRACISHWQHSTGSFQNGFLPCLVVTSGSVGKTPMAHIQPAELQVGGQVHPHHHHPVTVHTWACTTGLGHLEGNWFPHICPTMGSELNIFLDKEQFISPLRVDHVVSAQKRKFEQFLHRPRIPLALPFLMLAVSSTFALHTPGLWLLSSTPPPQKAPLFHFSWGEVNVFFPPQPSLGAVRASGLTLEVALLSSSPHFRAG